MPDVQPDAAAEPDRGPPAVPHEDALGPAERDLLLPGFALGTAGRCDSYHPGGMHPHTAAVYDALRDHLAEHERAAGWALSHGDTGGDAAGQSYHPFHAPADDPAWRDLDPADPIFTRSLAIAWLFRDLAREHPDWSTDSVLLRIAAVYGAADDPAGAAGGRGPGGRR